MTHETTTEADWKSVTTPFSVDLNEVVATADGPFAVGGSGTIVANRGQGWETVVDAGPGAKNRTLRSVDVTADGTRIWFAGASGAIGMYDIEKRRVYDYSRPKDISAAWTAIAVTGEAGAERLVVADDSGNVLPFEVDGLAASHGAPVKPGSGSSITGLTFGPDGIAYAVDTGGNVYEESAEDWTKTGIETAGVSLADVVVGPADRVYVAAANGTLYRYDPAGSRWKAIEVADTELRAVDIAGGHVAVLASSHTVYRRPLEGRTRWRQEAPPTSNGLLDIALGAPDVAVGKSGTVVERPNPEPTEEAAPGEEPPTAEPSDGVCDLLRAELLGRLDRAELLALLERHEQCEGTLAELLTEHAESKTVTTELRERTDQLPVLALPVTLDARGHAAAAGRRERRCCSCRDRAGALARVERLFDC